MTFYLCNYLSFNINILCSSTLFHCSSTLIPCSPTGWRQAKIIAQSIPNVRHNEKWSHRNSKNIHHTEHHRSNVWPFWANTTHSGKWPTKDWKGRFWQILQHCCAFPRGRRWRVYTTRTKGSLQVMFDWFYKFKNSSPPSVPLSYHHFHNFHRLYDREGNGYITTATLKEILAALDDNLSSRDLDGIIAEIDTDGSGTVDFDGEFKTSFTFFGYLSNMMFHLQSSWKWWLETKDFL